ncbi:zinc finger CCCH domain-containing protein 18-like isoform X2 [Momordica charantia]|uniref:Zinc finger CCCH domain-containing protein 18-like isoform X2 n=1 Tax=Momordica charantia TaxID=3673 RepID=A0A6J1DLS2_MOMCH|nr:zinc finger CCCH domain-containing protein 18-like isoform X2 [Momordica charantia]
MEFFSEYTKIVYSRIQKIEPENVTKIIGCLLLHDHCDQEMARLAMGPDQFLHEVIFIAKTELQQLSIKASNPNPGGFAARRHFPSWDQHLSPNKRSHDFIPLGYPDAAAMFELQNQAQFLSLEDHIDPLGSAISGFPTDVGYPDSNSMLSNLSTRNSSRHFLTVPEFQPKTCHYYNKGFCKHGNSCRYIHGSLNPESFSQMYNSNSVNDDQVFLAGSLKTLEMEIVDLLKSRRGTPISIASLPMIYYEKYGKVLQAEGYLTESQRHGKSGYSLTKLLARLKSSIRLIDRPHGQHAVILAEDAPKFMDNRSDKNDPGPIVSGSRQIYLTFPAESTFTEDDVSDYFSSFGMVEDVRIPCQQKRMFGFVTFSSADTVKTILTKGNPHYICGARVLVKPYREKSKLFDRKYQDRIEQQVYYSSHYADIDSELHSSIPRGYDAARMLRMEEQEQQAIALELERRHLLGLSSIRKSVINQPYFSYLMDELKVPEDHFNFPTTQRLNYLMDVIKIGSTSEDHNRPRNNTDSNRSDDSSQGLNLPDSPFASPIEDDISTLI